MNQKEWLEYFELVNGRKPNPVEFAKAKEAGEFLDDSAQTVLPASPVLSQAPSNAVATSSNQVQVGQVGEGNPQVSAFQASPLKKGLSKKTKIILFSVLGSLVGLSLLIGGYSLIRYQSGKIVDGTYDVIAYSRYDEDQDKMVDGLKEFKEDDVTVKDFLTVKDNHSKHYNYSETDDTVSVSLLESDVDITQVFDPWNKTQHQALTTSEYRKKINRFTKALQKDYSFYTDEAVKTSVDDAVKEFKEVSKQKRTYVKNGDQFTLSYYNEDGELESRITYKLMSPSKAKERNEDYKQAVKDYKKRMKTASDMYDRYFGDDSSYGYNYNYGYDYGYGYDDSYGSSSSDDTDSSKKRVGETI